MAAALLSAVELGAAPRVAVTPLTGEPGGEPGGGPSCTGAFVSQPLPHSVEPMPNLPMPFDSNGAGVAVADLDGDRHGDIVVGNDYDLADYVFVHADGRWQAGSPFAVTTRNTMGFASGDVANDGRLELFAADMRPYRSGPDIDAAWGPLLGEGGAATDVGDGVQIAANVLQTAGADGSYLDTAAAAGVAATGWSWSSQPRGSGLLHRRRSHLLPAPPESHDAALVCHFLLSSVS